MNLIIQSPREIATAHLSRLVGLTTATHTEQISTRAWRLRDAQPHDAVAAYCWENQLDYAFVNPQRRLNDFGLVVMDMDSTLITIECIDEIADMAHLKPQVAAITTAAMRGEMEFSESLRRRVALLQGLEENSLQRVYDERLQLNPGAEILLKRLQACGIKTLLVSGGFDFFAERLQSRLGLDYAYANTLEITHGKLTGNVLGNILDAQGKADHLVRVRDQLGLQAEQVIALGDGANDLKMMAQASVSIAYHAKPIVRAQASYAFNFVGLDGLLDLFAD